jgi:hypothetical protein
MFSKRVYCCELCDYKKEIGFNRLRCNHPAVLEIEESLEEKSPGLILVEALNKIGRALQVKIASDAYQKDKWMNFPFCYYQNAVDSCEGFKRVKARTRRIFSSSIRSLGPKPRGGLEVGEVGRVT